MANIAKNKRGRPKLLNDAARNIWAATNKRRQQDNKVYMAFINCLIYPDMKTKKLAAEPLDPIFLFLWDTKKDKIKTTILAELGRLVVRSGDEIALKAARVICENKMSTARALSFLRRFRKTKSDKLLSVLNRIIHLINDSDLSGEEIETLRQNLYDCLSPENTRGE